jgi:hypothetical protein
MVASADMVVARDIYSMVREPGTFANSIPFIVIAKTTIPINSMATRLANHFEVKVVVVVIGFIGAASL